ncbi:MAG: trehalose-phosphatase [Steroidobacteraceae bacterium]
MKDQLPPALLPVSQICLFLDFDGTLADFAMDPAQVQIDAQLVAILRRLQQALDGALALVSGRPIEDLDRLLDPLRLPTAGRHGQERRNGSGHVDRIAIPVAELQRVRPALEAFVAEHNGLLLEDKQSSLTVHYRARPQLEPLVRNFVARAAEPLLPHFQLLDGNHMVEIKPAAFDKSTAVEAFMREAPFSARVPVFIGDDITDQDGFRAVEQYSGIAISVGDRVTAAWHLHDPGAVRAWLGHLAESGALNAH